MPSLDVIRTVTVKGKADGVDDATAALNRLTASIQSANDNIAKANAQAANDNGWNITATSALSAANHLRQAAEAAYVFSPAFREVTNSLAAPALAGAASALEATAAGIVTATNVAGTGIVRLGQAVETTVPAFSLLSGSLKSAGAWMESFAPSAAGAAASVLGIAGAIVSRFLPIVGQILLVRDAIKLTGEAWTLGNEALAKYVALSQSAVATGVSTTFFQRLQKAAEDAKQPIDILTNAMKTLQSATSDQLGGTAAQQQLQKLRDAGNFKGNAGVADFASASTTEEKFKAITTLIDQALQKGQRLAALDVAKSFLGDLVAANLAKDSAYLDKMTAAAVKVSANDLVSQASVDNAVELQNRLDAAEKILSERWHPVQDVLIQAGVTMKETWVNIVENIAAAVDGVERLVAFIVKANTEELPSFNKLMTGFVNLTTTPESRAASEAQYGISSNPADIALSAARQRLGSGLQNPANVSAATDQVNAIQNKLFPDTSIDPNKVKDTTAAYDRATAAVQKYIETTNAETATVGLSTAAQEKAKVQAELTAAAMKDGLSREAAVAKANMSSLGDAAASAAEALAKARVASDIKFSGNTALLSAEDVQIATQLKGIYPDVATALGSVEAQAIRTNSAYKQLGSTIENDLTSGLTDLISGSKTAGQAFSDMSNMIVKAIEQMIIKVTIVEPLLRSLQSLIGGGGGGFGIASFLGLGGSGGASGGTGLSLSTTGGLYHTGGIVGAEPTSLRSVHPSLFSGAPRFHTGGIAGDEVPIIARKGEGVFTPGQMAALGGASARPVNVQVVNQTGVQADVQTTTGANGDVTVKLKKTVDGMVGDSLSAGTGRRVLGQQYGVKPFTGQ